MNRNKSFSLMSVRSKGARKPLLTSHTYLGAITVKFDHFQHRQYTVCHVCIFTTSDLLAGQLLFCGFTGETWFNRNHAMGRTKFNEN